MNQPSQLERFLQSEAGAGRIDSAGKFTLDRDQALRKLATFQLPFGTAWVVKLVQGVVASGASNLHIRQTGTDTHFEFQPPAGWTHPALARAFFEPEGSGDAALDQLMKGLWGASLNEGRPFQFIFAPESESLLWTGAQMVDVTADWKARPGLIVSHRKLSEGKGVIGIRSIEAARRNSEVLKTLVERAFTCPIPLTVDGLRMDALQLCPTYGLSTSSHPLLLGWVESGTPTYQLPPGSFSNKAERVFLSMHPKARTVTEAVVDPGEAPPAVFASWLVTAHFGLYQKGKSQIWKCVPKPSMLFWLQDGVVIASEQILHETEVSVAVFVSAQGLATDLGGFALGESKNREQRRIDALRAAQAQIANLQPVSLQELIEGNAQDQKTAGTALVVGGLLLLKLSPIHSLGLMAAGAASRISAGKKEQAVEEQLNQSIDKLKEKWPARN